MLLTSSYLPRSAVADMGGKGGAAFTTSAPTGNRDLLRYLAARECGLLRRYATRWHGDSSGDLARTLGEEKATLPVKNRSCELSGQSRATFLMTFSPDGTLIASTHGDHTVRVTDVQSGRCLHILTGHPRTPWCIAFHPTSNDILASGCLKGEVRIWDLRGGGSEHWASKDGSVIASVTFHPTDQVLVIATSHELLFWDWTRPEPFASCKTASKYERVKWVKFDPLGHQLLTAIANTTALRDDNSASRSNTNVSYINREPSNGTDERRRLRQRYTNLVQQITNHQRDRILPGIQLSRDPPPGDPPEAIPAEEDIELDSEESYDIVEEQAPPPSSTSQIAGMTFSGPHHADIAIVEPQSPQRMETVESGHEYASVLSRRSALELSARIVPPSAGEHMERSEDAHNDIMMEDYHPPSSTSHIAGMTFSGPHHADLGIVEPRSPVNLGGSGREFASIISRRDALALSSARQYAADVTRAAIAGEDVEREVIRVRNEHAVEEPEPSQAAEYDPMHDEDRAFIDSFEDTVMPPTLWNDGQARHSSLSNQPLSSLLTSHSPISRNSTGPSLSSLPTAMPIQRERREPQDSILSSLITSTQLSQVVPTSTHTASSMANSQSVATPSVTTGAFTSILRSRLTTTSATSTSATSTSCTVHTTCPGPSTMSLLRSRLTHQHIMHQSMPAPSSTNTLSLLSSSASSLAQQTTLSSTSTSRSSFTPSSIPSHQRLAATTNTTSINSSSTTSTLNTSTLQGILQSATPAVNLPTASAGDGIQCLVCGHQAVYQSPNSGPYNHTHVLPTPQPVLPSVPAAITAIGRRRVSSAMQSSRSERSRRHLHGTHRLAVFCENEMRQVIERVRARQLLIRETLQALNQLQEEADGAVPGQPTLIQAETERLNLALHSEVLLTENLDMTSLFNGQQGSASRGEAAGENRNTDNQSLTMLGQSTATPNIDGSTTPSAVSVLSEELNRRIERLNQLERNVSVLTLQLGVRMRTLNENRPRNMALRNYQYSYDMRHRERQNRRHAHIEEIQRRYGVPRNARVIPEITVTPSDETEGRTVAPVSAPRLVPPSVLTPPQHALLPGMSPSLVPPPMVPPLMVPPPMVPPPMVPPPMVPPPRIPPPMVPPLPTMVALPITRHSIAPQPVVPPEVPSVQVSEAEGELRGLQESLRREERLQESSTNWSRFVNRDIEQMRAEMLRRLLRERERELTWHTLERRQLHPHYAVSILDDTINQQNDGLQAAINRAIAGAFMGTGEAAVASNIVNLTHRIQAWDFTTCSIPDISDSTANVLVPHCKLHNDASVDISADGSYLATFVPSHRGFPDDTILGVFSLQLASRGQCLYTKSFGPNAISLSLSPLNNYVLVGLAAKRLAWVFTPKQMVAQVYKLKTPQAGEDSMEHICDLMHPCDMDIRSHISVNSARWLPRVGEGVVYGTNRGDLHICRPGDDEKAAKAGHGVDTDGSESHSIRRNLLQMLGLAVPSTTSTSTQTIHRLRRTASTQTDAPTAPAGES